MKYVENIQVQNTMRSSLKQPAQKDQKQKVFTQNTEIYLSHNLVQSTDALHTWEAAALTGSLT